MNFLAPGAFFLGPAPAGHRCPVPAKTAPHRARGAQHLPVAANGARCGGQRALAAPAPQPADDPAAAVPGGPDPGARPAFYLDRRRRRAGRHPHPGYLGQHVGHRCCPQPDRIGQTTRQPAGRRPARYRAGDGHRSRAGSARAALLQPRPPPGAPGHSRSAARHRRQRPGRGARTGLGHRGAPAGHRDHRAVRWARGSARAPGA